MTTWSPTELGRIGRPEELQLSSRRLDGTLRNYVPIWLVRVDENINVRAVYGLDTPCRSPKQRIDSWAQSVVRRPR